MKAVKDEEHDDLWGAIAAPVPKSGSNKQPLNLRPAAAAVDPNDPWAAIAAPPPTTTVKPLSVGRGRAKPAPRLGAQRINRTSSTDM